MRYALLSDIHGNLPALEAVLADISAHVPDARRYHLGDLGGYAPWVNEVVGLIRREEIPGVAGNYDSTVANDYKHCGCKYEDPVQEAQSHLSYEWTRAQVTHETKKYLAGLPFRLDLTPGGGHLPGPRIILVHGTPTLNTLYWTEDRPGDFCLKMAQIAGARTGDVLAFGHTHRPWHREVEGIHFINTGSVGRPKDGDPRAGYVLLTVPEGDGAPGITVEFRRVTYDIERTCDAITASTLPHEFADFLRTGGKPAIRA